VASWKDSSIQWVVDVSGQPRRVEGDHPLEWRQSWDEGVFKRKNMKLFDFLGRIAQGAPYRWPNFEEEDVVEGHLLARPFQVVEALAAFVDGVIWSPSWLRLSKLRRCVAGGPIRVIAARLFA